MFVHQETQSGPDSQTAPPQARNTWRSCSATLSHGRNIGFAGGRVGEQFRLCWLHSSVCRNHNNPQTKPGYLRHWLSLLGCQFGHSGSSGLVGSFRRFRWSCCVYLRQGFIAVGVGVDIGILAIPNESGGIFEAVWKAETACVRIAHTLCRDWRFYVGYGCSNILSIII